ncbi:MAG: M16 family metallopeptidase [Candidatus Acidiferrales bacterium]
MKSRWLLIAGIAATLGTPVGAQTQASAVQPPKIEVQSTKLENGLEVLMVEDHHSPMVNLEVWYHVGSKDEEPGRTGFAHLFEHLMFKGSAHVGPEEHSRIIEAVGGFDNAFTQDDYTQYFETFPSNYLERVLWLEADRMGSLNVDEANFLSERKVVEEERRLRVDNQPYGLVQLDLYAAAFQVHGYHHTPIGSIEDLEKATLEEVRQFHDTYYKPNNATIVIVGDITPSEVFGWAKKYFGGIPRSAKPIPRRDTPEPAQDKQRIVEKAYPNAPLPAVVEGYKMPAEFSADSYALQLAANILSQGESSRLYQSLVYKQQIAVQAAGFGNFTEDPNLFWVIAIMNPQHTVAEGEKSLDAALTEMKEKPVDARELEKAKNQILAQFILQRSGDQAKADAVGNAVVIGKDLHLVNEELGRYMQVTPEDIQRVAQKYFTAQNETVLRVTPPAAENKGSGR